MDHRELIEAWVEAFNAGDVRTISNFYTDDAVNHQIANEPVIGKS